MEVVRVTFMLNSFVRLLPYLGLFSSTHDCGCGGGARGGGRLVGKVSLFKKVVLVLLNVYAGSF
jgi:hypothetical protein